MCACVCGCGGVWGREAGVRDRGGGLCYVCMCGGGRGCMDMCVAVKK